MEDSIPIAEKVLQDRTKETHLKHKRELLKNWPEADRVRDQLKTMGIVLEDRKDGTVGWRRG